MRGKNIKHMQKKKQRSLEMLKENLKENFIKKISIQKLMIKEESKMNSNLEMSIIINLN